MSKKYDKELLELLKDDILERYNNEEYWDKDIIDNYEADKKLMGENYE